MWLGAAAAQGPARPGAPPSVTVVAVQNHDVTRNAEFIARVEAIQSVKIQARVEGYLQQVAFKEGQDVHAGDLLYVIEPGLYEASLASAQAQVQQAQASLREAERNLARNQELAKRGNVSQATLDQATAQRDTAAAQLAAAQAAVKTAQINLGYTRITSPIDGRIGATAVTVGNAVGPNSGALATVVQLDPIRVVFSVNQRDLVAVKQRSPNATQAEINARFVPTLRLPDGSMYGETGRIAFISNTVDPATGTIPVYADFPNPHSLILPGMVATALVRPEQPQRAITVPVAAVLQDQKGKYVLIVDSNNRVVERRIETNGQMNQEWVVASGLQQGDEVVVEGVQKVRPGQVVRPVPQGSQPSQ